MSIHHWRGKDVCAKCGLRRRIVEEPHPTPANRYQKFTIREFLVNGRWLSKTPQCPVPPEQLIEEPGPPQPPSYKKVKPTKPAPKDRDTVEMIREVNRLLRIAGLEAALADEWLDERDANGNANPWNRANKRAAALKSHYRRAVIGAIHVASMESY